MIEIEKRYLLRYLPVDLYSYPFVEIEDRKLLTSEPHPHIRLRRQDQKYEITKKYSLVTDDHQTMIEETIALNKTEFDMFKRLPNSGQIKKRYLYNKFGINAEINIWDDNLKGLALVEFEFSSNQKAQKFIPPDFCLIETTQLEWLSGGALSGKTYNDLVEQLKKLGYTKI